MKHQVWFSYLYMMKKIFVQSFVLSHVLWVAGEAGVQDLWKKAQSVSWID